MMAPSEKNLSLSDLYIEAEREDMEICAVSFKNRVALTRPDGLVAIDYSKITTEAQEKAVLLEEIGHFCTSAFYPKDAPFAVWEKQERKAARFIFEKYYPPLLIAKKMHDGVVEPWEIADELGLPERFVRELLKFYAEVRVVDYSALMAELEEEGLPVPDLENEDEAKLISLPPRKPKENTVEKQKPPIKFDHKDKHAKALLRAKRGQLTGLWY